MSAYERIKAEAERLFPEAVEIRRALHRIPEEGLKEYKTSAFVIDYLSRLGLDDIRTKVAETGVVATLKGAHPGPTVAIRADMDGLPITEQTGLPFKSEHEGWMHGCGHDSHTAGLLAAAKLLSGMRDELSGTVKFLFQPAEEGPGGALRMIEEGALDGVDFVVGGHVWGDYLPGQAAFLEGPMFAAPDIIEIEITGVGGHAAAPHETVDTVPVMAAIVNALQTIVSRRIDPAMPCVVTIGTVNAGYRHNVIADKCKLTGTVRTYDKKVQDIVKRSIREMVEGIASAMGAEASVNYKELYPALVNDAAVTETMRELAAEMLGAENVVKAAPTMGGEDFSYFLKKVPGTFMFIGSANAGGKYSDMAHNPCFNLDERALVVMMKLYAGSPFALNAKVK